jgi:thymidylate synthase
MTILDDRYAVATNLSEGWLDAVRLLERTTRFKAVHLLIRILDPIAEDSAIRAAAQGLIDDFNATHTREKPDIDTTRNTIFPASWARRNPEPADLAAYYRQRYTKEGLLGFRDNSRGTYFGRLVAYPRGKDEEPGDQLTDTIRKLRDELGGRGPKSSRYEMNVYSERKDRNPMSFPCLAHLSVHLREGELHMQAVYRNEHLVARAYGNYLGLAQLQSYMAERAEVAVGELLLTVGHVELDAGKRAIRAMLAQFPQAD